MQSNTILQLGVPGEKRQLNPIQSKTNIGFHEATPT